MVFPMWPTLCILLLGASSTVGQAGCGRTPVPPLEAPNDANIIGGIVARPYSWPWQVVLEGKTWGEQKFGCTGTIVTDQWIMTAAHCFLTNPVQARVGVFNQTDASEPGEQLFNFTDFHVHPNFNFGAANNDIALLKLDRPIVFNDHVQPVCLTADTDKVAHTGDRLYTTGWGATKEPVPFKDDVRLRQVALPLVAVKECERDYPGPDIRFDRDSMLCAGYGGHAPCNGDVGDPLVRKHTATGRWYQVGIASSGKLPCAVDQNPVIFTKVAHMCDFIEEGVGTKLCKSF